VPIRGSRLVGIDSIRKLTVSGSLALGDLPHPAAAIKQTDTPTRAKGFAILFG